MAKARVTWLGESGPKSNEKDIQWGGFTFEKGEPVEVEINDDNRHLLTKAYSNKYFKVEGFDPAAEPPPAVVVPPSKATMPGPVPKPGEPAGSVSPAPGSGGTVPKPSTEVK